MALPIVSSSRYSTQVPSLGTTVEYRPYVVKEEKILMIAMESKNQKQIIRAIKDVITACVFDNIDASKLTSLDIEVLFLKLRGKSVGERADLRFKCGTCEAMTDVSINLEDVAVPELDVKSRTIMIDNKVGVVVRYPSITDMEKYTDKQLSSVDGVMSLITDCIESIFDDDSSAWLCEFDTESIKNKIEKIISLSKDAVAEVGVKGQNRLLEIRNNERIANDLAHQLDIM